MIDAAVAAGRQGHRDRRRRQRQHDRGRPRGARRARQEGRRLRALSRVATGRVGRNVEVDDDKLGLVASDDLNPQKARVLLRLALLKPRSLAEIQRLFVEY